MYKRQNEGLSPPPTPQAIPPTAPEQVAANHLDVGHHHGHAKLPRMRFLEEIKRRNVGRVAILYIVVSYVVLEVFEMFFHLLEMPPWTGRAAVLLAVLGFPIALLIAWAYEITPEGLKPTEEVPPQKSIARRTGRRLDRAIIAVMAIALAYFITDKLWLSKRVTLSPEHMRAAAAAAAAAPSPSITETLPEKSVAVLPFLDMSAKHDQEYFADGLAEELINRLVAVRDLQVSARTSSFSFKGKSATIPEIAKVLSVRYILEGSIRGSEPTMRITAQLVRAADGYHVWSQTYDRHIKDFLKTQDDISDAIAVTLASRFTVPPRLPGEYPSGQLAYMTFLESRSPFHDSRRFAEAIRLLRETVTLEPTFSRGWASLADATANLATYDVKLSKDERNSRLRDALAIAQRAIETGPNRNYGFVSLANMAMLRRDWSAARRYLDEARAKDPQHPNVQAMTAVLCFALGDFGCSLETASRMAEAEPSQVLARFVIGDSLSALGRHEEALREYRRAAAVDPVNGDVSEEIASQFLFLHQPQSALGALQSGSDDISRKEVTAIALQQMGRHEESVAIVSGLASRNGQLGGPSAFAMARLHAALGETAAALAWLQKSSARDEGEVIGIRGTFAPYPRVVADPRFHTILRALDLPD